MLQTSRSGDHLATCEMCRATERLDVASFDEARELLRGRGWLECARRGVGVSRWLWFCVTCKPKPTCAAAPSVK